MHPIAQLLIGVAAVLGLLGLLIRAAYKEACLENENRLLRTINRNLNLNLARLRNRLANKGLPNTVEAIEGD